jgi:hypothetical protein
MRAVAALRADAALRHWQATWAARDDGDGGGPRTGPRSGGGGVGLQVSIKQFPLGYSTRNLCIAGMPEPLSRE